MIERVVQILLTAYISTYFVFMALAHLWAGVSMVGAFFRFMLT